MQYVAIWAYIKSNQNVATDLPNHKHHYNYYNYNNKKNESNLVGLSGILSPA